jgi:hypothetical protein
MSKRTAESFDAPAAHDPGQEPAEDDQQLPMPMHVDHAEWDAAAVQDDAAEAEAGMDLVVADAAEPDLPADAGYPGTQGWFKRWTALPDGSFRCKWHFRRPVNN